MNPTDLDLNSMEEPGQADAVAWADEFWRHLEDQPHGYDLFQVLRWVEARGGLGRKLGKAATPRQEPLRLKQIPHMAFAPSMVAGARQPGAGRPASLTVAGFGLFGPNGPLPLHITEYARERLMHHGDGALAAFADVFHQRLIALFYRAWADAQSAASLDHPQEDFSRYLRSLLHHTDTPSPDSGEVAPHARYVMAGQLLRQTRNAEGLIRILSSYFGIEVSLQEFHPRWVRLEAGDRLALGGGHARLARDTVLGAALRDAQHAFRLTLGPMRLADYMQFLPGRAKARQLRDWVREYVGLEFAWDARLILDKRDAAGLQLGRPVPLGHASWLGQRRASQGDAADLLVLPERQPRPMSVQERSDQPTTQDLLQ